MVLGFFRRDMDKRKRGNGSPSEFAPSVEHLGQIRFRVEAVDPQTGRCGRSRWMGALAIDVAEGESTGLQWEDMSQEAYADIYRDQP